MIIDCAHYRAPAAWAPSINGPFITVFRNERTVDTPARGQNVSTSQKHILGFVPYCYICGESAGHARREP